MHKLILTSLLIFNQVVFASNCITKRETFIDNASTKVWKTTICPQQKLAFHNHQHARILIPDENGRLHVIYKSGKKVLIKLKKHTPIFLSIAQGKALHQDENPGKEPLHVTVIELKAN